MFAYILPVTAEHNIMLPSLPDIIYSVICVCILALVLRKVLPKFNSVINERIAKIEAGISASDTAKTELAKAKRQIEDQKIEALKEANQIRDLARADAKKIVEDAKAQAKLEADRIIDLAHRQIQSEYQLSQNSLRSEVGTLACELADKIVGEHLQDKELSARVIDRFLDDLQKQVEQVKES